MRITSENAGSLPRGYPTAAASSQNAQSPDGTGKVQGVEKSFDQVDISKDLSSEAKFQRELAARLVQEVRTATSTGDIQQIKEQVDGGTYPVNPESIASAMLLEK